MLRNWLIIIILGMIGFVSASAVAKAAPPLVDTVQVEVQAEGHLPLLIKRRMEASVHTIADQVLIGHTVRETMLKRSEYEQLIREVFNRILIGYTVSAVQITPGTDTQVIVQLVPWDEVIQKIDTTVQVDGIDRKSVV